MPDGNGKLTQQTWVSLGTVIAILGGSLGVMYKINSAESSTLTRLALLEKTTQNATDEIKKIGSFVQENSKTISAQLERNALTRERIDSLSNRIQRMEERQDALLERQNEFEKELLKIRNGLKQ